MGENLYTAGVTHVLLLTTTTCQTDVNRDYAVCDSYPQALVVATGVADDVYAEVARYRSRGRIPVLAWTVNDAAAGCIVRCSQVSRRRRFLRSCGHFTLSFGVASHWGDAQKVPTRRGAVCAPRFTRWRVAHVCGCAPQVERHGQPGARRWQRGHVAISQLPVAL